MRSIISHMSTQKNPIYSYIIGVFPGLTCSNFLYMIVVMGFTGCMDSNNYIQPFWCIIRCMKFFNYWECIFNGCLMEFRGAWQRHQAVESFVHIINEGGAAAAVVILHIRLHTQPLFRRHMISSWKYAVSMVKYSINKAHIFLEKVDS